jgi:tetratricopeptide (TPR) repeat protein
MAAWATLALFPPSANGEEASAPLGGESSTAGDSSPDFDQLVSDAVALYGERAYEEAIELFQRAHELRAEPELIYNIGRSYERLARHDEAMRYYQRFLELPGTTGELRTRALSNMASLREEQEAIAAARREAERAAAGRESRGDEQNDVALRDGLDATPTGARPLKITGWTLFSVGAAMAIGGGVFGLLATSAHQDFEGEGLSEARLDLRDDVRSRSLAADVLLGAGGAVAVAGATLLIIDAVRRGGADPGAADGGLSARRSGAARLSWGFGLAGGPGLTVAGNF